MTDAEVIAALARTIACFKVEQEAVNARIAELEANRVIAQNLKSRVVLVPDAVCVLDAFTNAELAKIYIDCQADCYAGGYKRWDSIDDPAWKERQAMFFKFFRAQVTSLFAARSSDAVLHDTLTA